jgi:predicted nucleic acid-binding protein
VSEREGFLDTCTVVHLEALAEDLPAVAHVSEVTMCELEAGVATAQTDELRSARRARLDAIRRIAIVHPLDADCSRAFAQVAADLRLHGRKVSARSYDALIAATAIANGLPLFTTNPGDFQHIDGLDLRALESPDGA